MNQDLEAIRGADAAFARGDIPALLALPASDARRTEAEGGPRGGTFVGPGAVLEDVFQRTDTELLRRPLR